MQNLVGWLGQLVGASCAKPGEIRATVGEVMQVGECCNNEGDAGGLPSQLPQQSELWSLLDCRKCT